MFCRQCEYALDGLETFRCPECGRTFDPDQRRSYRRSPRQWQFRMAVRAVLRAALRITGFACLALLIAGLITGGWLYRRYSSERAVIARLEACVDGCAVGRKPSGPAWLRRWTAFRSHPWMKTVTLVHVTGGSLPEDILAKICRLPDLIDFSLDQTKIDGSGLRHLQTAPNLIHVQLELVGLEDDDLVHLAALRNLKTLVLSCPKVTDKGLRHLQGMTNLRRLHLTGTRVTFFGRRELQRALPNLIIRGR